MCRHVTDLADPAPDRLKYRSGDGPSPHSPRHLKQMDRNFTRFVSIVSIAEDIFSQIDWQEVKYILWQGIKGFIALAILVSLYTVEGVRSFYKWTQPRLSNLLQHPQQTIKNGPASVRTEAWESVADGSANALQRVIVRGEMFSFYYINLISRKVSVIRQSLTVGNIIAWAKVQRMA